MTDPADIGRVDGGPDAGGADAGGYSPRSKQRLALARVLIWAEREASTLGHEAVAERLEDAIQALYRDMD